MPKAEKTAASKKKKDPNAPKRPQSAYMFFCQAERATIKKENPDATFGEIGKLLGEAWANADAETKEAFNKKAAKDKERYEKESAAYKPEEVRHRQEIHV